MQAQMEIVKKHLDEHKYLRKIEDQNEALASFINDYGWLIREIYCTKVCGKKSECVIADNLSKVGDLLKNHLPKGTLDQEQESQVSKT
jgi:hypothetical protein